MSEVAAWLDSPAGVRWTRQHFTPVVYGEPSIAQIYPGNAFSTYVGETSEGIHNPAHDPCGRPPLAP